MNYQWSPLNRVVKTEENFYLLFAGITGNIYKISEKKANIIKNNDSLFIETLSDTEINNYVREGILIEKDIEKLILKAQVKSIKDISKQILYISILPTLNCNLGCDYCFMKESLKEKNMTKDTIKKIVNLIESRGKEFSLDWFGGEPTLVCDLMAYFFE